MYLHACLSGENYDAFYFKITIIKKKPTVFHLTGNRVWSWNHSTKENLPNSTNITRRLPSSGEIPNPTRCGVNGPIQAIVPRSTIQTRKLSASRGTWNNKFKFKFLYCLFYREYIEDYIYNKGYNNRNVYLLTAARISQNLGMRIWTLSLIFENKIPSNL